MYRPLDGCVRSTRIHNIQQGVHNFISLNPQDTRSQDLIGFGIYQIESANRDIAGLPHDGERHL